MTCDTLLTYADFIETFKIHTNASVFQLGAIRIQKGKPVAFYTRKMTDPQQRYRETERELISIVENIKGFRTLLLGHKSLIYTYHKNLTCECFSTDRSLIQRLILE